MGDKSEATSMQDETTKLEDRTSDESTKLEDKTSQSDFGVILEDERKFSVMWKREKVHLLTSKSEILCHRVKRKPEGFVLAYIKKSPGPQKKEEKVLMVHSFSYHQSERRFKHKLVRAVK